MSTLYLHNSRKVGLSKVGLRREMEYDTNRARIENVALNG